jgi:hypothetical protein
MALFESQAQLRGGWGSAYDAKAQTSQALADTLSGFGRQTFGIAKEMHVARSTQEAMEADVSEGYERRSELSAGGRAYNQVVMAGYAANVKNDYTKRIGELAIEFADDPEGFESAATSYKAETLNSVEPELRGAIERDFERAAINPYLKIHAGFEQAQLNGALKEIEAASNTFLDDAAKAARAGDEEGLEHNRDSVIAQSEMLRDMGREDLAGALEQKFSERVNQQLVLGQADYAIHNGEGEAFIKDFIENPPEHLTPEQVDSYSATMLTMNSRYKSVSAVEQAELTISQQRDVSNLKVFAKNGLGEPEDLMATTEQYFDQGWITEPERTSIVNDLMRADKDRAAKSANYADIMKRIDGDDSVVLTAEDVNSFYDDIWAPMMVEGKESAIQQAQIATYVNRVKQVPASLKNRLQTYAVSGDIDLITEASAIIDKVDQTPGLTDSVFKPDQQAFVETAVLLAENLDPKEAVRLAQQTTRVDDQARIQSREKIIKDDDWKSEYRGDVESFWNPWFGSTQVDDITGDRIAREYGALVESYFKSGMSEDASKAKAEQVLKRNYSTWNGRVMKYSPDAFYQVAGSTDYVLDQLYSDVKRNYYTDEPLKKKSLILISNEETARTAATGSPSYRVAIVDDGGIQMLDGVTWRPDVDKQKNKVINQNKSVADQIVELE